MWLDVVALALKRDQPFSEMRDDLLSLPDGQKVVDVLFSKRVNIVGVLSLLPENVRSLVSKLLLEV